MYRCDQSNIADSDDLPLTLVFDDVALARLLQIDGAQDDSIFECCKFHSYCALAYPAQKYGRGEKIRVGKNI